MSPAAWNWAWDLVSPEKKAEVQFFGASTISIKLSKFWHEVPADQVKTSREFIKIGKAYLNLNIRVDHPGTLIKVPSAFFRMS